MKRLHRILSALLIAAMLLTVLPTFVFGTGPAEEGTVVSQTVTYKETTVDIFRYTPADFNFLGNNTPILFVLGDQAYTEETANEALNTLGFKKIADEESAHVIFVSPAGESWSEADVASIQALAGNASDNYYYGTDYSAGISAEGKLYAGRFRHYYFAEGTAVTFAKTYLDTEGVSRPIPEWYAQCDVYGADFIYAEDGFEKESIASAWEQSRLISRMYINSNVTFPTPYYYWEEEGIALTVETLKTEYEDLPEIEYYFYVPDTVDLASETEEYPLVLLFHGSGMHPDAVAQNTTWPILGKKEGFVVASVNGMYNTTNNANAMADLIDHLVENYAIDPSRVYASGFSKGTSESMKIAEAYSGKLAGVGLYEAVYGNFPVYEPTLTMPTYTILGQDEFYTVFPRDTENAVASFNALGKVNGFTYAYDEAIGGFWGYEFDETEVIELTSSRAVMNVHSIASDEDGIVYTKMVDVENVSHNIVPASAEYVWDFLKQFSRNEDGTLTVSEEAGVVAQTVTYKESSVDIFRYTPKDFNFLGNNTPLIFVLGDKPYTEETANEALVALGYKEIADRESAHIIFVSPTNGESWIEADYPAMQILAGNATDNYYYGNDYSAGVSEDGKFYSGRFRHYIFAEGTAVDFAKTYLDVDGANYYVPEWYSTTDAFGAAYVYAPDGFTVELVNNGWDEIREINRIFTNNYVTFQEPYFYWEECGITATVETIETEYDDLPVVEYYMYVPEEVDLESETAKYPLVLLFHGSGMHPDAVAQISQWPVVGKEEGFVVLSVSGMYNTENNANVMAQLIDHMVSTYAIDASRVYASGFSKGTSESMKIAEAYSEKLAGVGLFEPVYGIFPVYEPTLTMPVYAILGHDEFYKVFPRDTENAVASLNALGKVNGFTYAYDDTIGGLWGYEFDLTESLRYEEGRVVFNENSIASEEDGIVYTKLVDGFNLTHDVHPDSTREMWKFLSQFSRNADGSLTVEEKNDFADVSRTEWYYYPVKAAVRAGLFKGVTETGFAPTDTMTRAMLVTTLYRMAGSPETAGENPFTDVPAGIWYEDAVIWAVENGVVKGITETSFAPEENITREQTVTMLYRYAEKMGLDVSAKAELEAFADFTAVSEYAADSIAWAVGSGLIKGSLDRGSLYLNPLSTATRAEAATMLVRFYTLIASVGIE